MTRPFLAPGDTILLAGGVYRPEAEPTPLSASVTDEALIRPVASGAPGTPITVIPKAGETVVLTARFLASAWTLHAGSVFYHEYATPVSFPFNHPFQVTQDANLLYAVGSLAGVDRPGRSYVDQAAKRIYVWTTDGRSPAAHVMEYSSVSTGIDFRSGVKHWRLSGFSVVGFKSAGVMIRTGAGSIEIEHMDISHSGVHRPGGALTNGYAVATYDTTGANHVHHNNLHNTLAEVVHVSQSGAGGDLYESNDIHNAGGAEWLREGYPGKPLIGSGMIIRGNRITIRGNRIYANGYHGLVLESDLFGSEGASTPSDNLVDSNVITGNAGNGIYADGKNGASASAGNVIRSNACVGNNLSRVGSGDGELRLAGNFDQTEITANTLSGDRAMGILVYSLVLAGGAQGADAAPDQLTLSSNVALYAGSDQRVYPLSISGAQVSSMDYDSLFRQDSGAVIRWDGAEFFSVAELAALTGFEQHGFSLRK